MKEENYTIGAFFCFLMNYNHFKNFLPDNFGSTTLKKIALELGESLGKLDIIGLRFLVTKRYFEQTMNALFLTSDNYTTPIYEIQKINYDVFLRIRAYFGAILSILRKEALDALDEIIQILFDNLEPPEMS